MNNFSKLMKAVAASDVDAIMLTSPVNRLYASGFDASDGAAVITADKAWFFTDSRYIEAAQNTITEAEVLMVDRDWPYSRRINDVIASENVKKLGFEEERTTYSEYTIWKEKLNAELIPAQSIVTDLRAVKTPEELDFLIQELNREANTIGSKCNDAELARTVVDLKAEIEKLREQVQNVE